MKKKILILLVAILPVLTGGRCNCHRYEFNWQTFRFERLGHRLPQIRQDKQTREKLVREQKTIPPKGSSYQQNNLSRKEKKVLISARLYRLYMGSKSAESAIPEENLIILRHAPTDKLAELLEMLCPGEGPGGSVRLRFILYRDPTIWEQAKQFATKLDVPVWKRGKIEPNNWNTAIGMIYATHFPRKLEPEMRFKILSRLNQVITEQANDIKLRWASAIIAANINSQFEPRDLIAARAYLERAEKLARGNNYLALVTKYHEIKLLQLKRNKIKMMQLCQKTLDRYRLLENTECYQIILNILRRK